MATNPTQTKGPYIGIDFGTTKTMVAVYDPDRRTAMPVTLGRGRFELPTSIYHPADGGTLFGDEADDEGLTDSPNHVRRFKTKLGKSGFAHVGRHPATAVALTADFLRHVRSRLVREVVHAEVNRIVLTVPALFGPAQRSALAEAAEQAGFTEVELLAEPSAAGIAYLDHQSAFGSVSRFLVADWGGGTFDVALIERTPSGDLRIDPALVTGLLELGGENLDDDLWALASTHLERLGYGRLDSQPTVHWGNYRRELSGAKERLSNVPVSRSRFVLGGDPVNIELARADFENVIRSKVEEAVGFVSRLLADCNTRARTPEFILLAGGTSRIPLFGDILGKSTSLECRQWSSGRESIALGAAVHAFRVFGACEKVAGKPCARPEMSAPADIPVGTVSAHTGAITGPDASVGSACSADGTSPPASDAPSVSPVPAGTIQPAKQVSRSNLTATLGSLVIPGLGQLDQGRNKDALVHFGLALLLWLVGMGWAVHLASAFGAATYKRD